MAKGKYNKLLTARRNYFSNGGVPNIDAVEYVKNNPAELRDLGLKSSINTGGINVGNIIEGAAGLANTITGTLGNDTMNTRIINPTTTNPITSDSFDRLSEDWSNYADQRLTTGKDFFSKSALDEFSDGLNAGLQGFSSGMQIGGPWAGAAFATVGTGTSVLSSILARNKARKRSAEINRQIRYANDFNKRALNERAMNLINEQADTLESSYFSDGGPIHIDPKNRGKFTETKRRTGKTTEELTHSSNPLTRKRAIFAQNARHFKHSFGGELNTQGGDFTNNLLYIDSGNSHETNPNEGVQLGVDSEGVPNLVEEGETVFNDYVFSRRLKVPNKLRKKYKLRDSISFADASKELAKESEERPNDPISRNGLMASMSDLANAQEKVRESKERNQYANGGKVNKFEDGSIKDNPFNVDNDFYSDDYKEFYNFLKLPENKEASLKLLGKINNGDFGSIGNTPLSEDDMYRLATSYENNPVYNAFTGGTKKWLDWTNSLPTENGVTEEPILDNVSTEETILRQPTFMEDPMYAESMDAWDTQSKRLGMPGIMAPSTMPNVKDYKTRRSLRDRLKDIDFNDTMLRYAPVLGLGISSLTDAFEWTNKPDYGEADAIAEAAKTAGQYQPVEYTPIGNYLTYKPFDRDYRINQLNASSAASRRALTQNAGISRGAANAALLASDYNYNLGLGNLAKEAEEYNLKQRQVVEDFNRATNMTNAQAKLQADMANQKAKMELGEFNFKGSLAAAEMRQKERLAANAAKSANLTGLFQGLGDIGYEAFSRNMANTISPYYKISRRGKITYTNAYKELSKEDKKKIDDEIKLKSGKTNG